MATVPYDAAVAFGRFVLDRRDERLIGPDGPVHIGNKAFRVLAALIAERGRLVTKDNLFESVWDGTVVSESALTSVIKELRRALGDESRDPHFIESVYGRGYRFLADVAPATAAAVARPVAAAVAPAQSPHSKWRAKWRVAGRTIAGVASAGAGILALVNGIQQYSNPPVPAKIMAVRFTGFERLSGDVPESLTKAIGDETIAAFGDDGVVGVSTGALSGGTGPAYRLSGTVRRAGEILRVTSRLDNERTGALLWSRTTEYPAAATANLPNRIAVESGNMARCGLFAASTYPRALPDRTLALYLQFCHNAGLIEFAPERALDFARRAAQATPDFAGAWSSVAQFALFTAQRTPPPDGQSLRAEAMRANAAALRLDPEDSQGWANKADLLDPSDFTGREAMYLRALRARPLDCGCEHNYYGDFLLEVGRIEEAQAQYRRALDIMRLDGGTHIRLARTLLASGQKEEAKQHIDRAIELAGDPSAYDIQLITLAPWTHDYAFALARLSDPGNPVPPAKRAIWIAAFRALASGDADKRASAALPLQQNARSVQDTGIMTAVLLSALGLPRDALIAVDTMLARGPLFAHRALFEPTMDAARRQPEFAPLATKMGLVRYWRQSKRLPDFCKAVNPPPLCQSLR